MATQQDPVPAIVESVAAEDHEYKSRWGYHPCAYETYEKLKRMRKRYFQWMRQAAAHRRWDRKMPHNRVQRTYARNELGQRTAVLSTVAMGEPLVCPLLAPVGQTIMRLYERARMPQATPQKAFTPTSVADLDRLHASIEDWFTANGKK